MSAERRGISDGDAEILQELMNIAFGQAAADLGQVIDMYVVLSVPRVRVTSAGELPRFLDEIIGAEARISIVEQEFWGTFRGHALLVLPANSSQALLTSLGAQTADEREPEFLDSAEPMELLERETLMEVGNIIMGACVGKLSELLRCVVSYSPPGLMVHDATRAGVRLGAFDPACSVIVLQTLFCFGDQGAGGHVLLVISDESFQWLKAALADFVASYAQD
jgi:chemotaxis protein CheC